MTLDNLLEVGDRLKFQKDSIPHIVIIDKVTRPWAFAGQLTFYRRTKKLGDNYYAQTLLNDRNYTIIPKS